MLPLIVDLGFGYRAYGYTLLFAVALLAVVMVGTIGRPRLLRRRLLCVPIGVFCGLVLSGAFMNDELFWWPFLGSSFPHDALLPAAWVVVVEELVGLVVCWFLVGQYDLYLPGPAEISCERVGCAPRSRSAGAGRGMVVRAGYAGRACAPSASTTNRPSPGPSATGMPSASSSARSSSAERPIVVR